MMQPITRRNIGDEMPDGTIYSGISPDTAKEIYAAPADAPLTMTFNEAADYAKQVNLKTYLGHDDWRVPTKNEVNVLFNNCAEIGGFNIGGSYPWGRYWSSSSYDRWNAWSHWFSDRAQRFDTKDTHSYVRLVRLSCA